MTTTVYLLQPKKSDFTCFLQGGVPPSINAGLIEEYGTNKKFRIKLQHHSGRNLYDGDEIKARFPNARKYQTSRRQQLAVYGAVSGNLNFIQAQHAGKDPSITKLYYKKILTKGYLKLLNTTATPIDIGRLNAITNVLILKELHQSTQLRERMLATLTILVAQNNSMSGKMQAMQYNKALKEIEKKAYGYQDDPTSTVLRQQGINVPSK